MLVHVPRSSLGICVSSKGLVCGRVSFSTYSTPGSEDVTECTHAVRPIPGDCQAIQKYQFTIEARYHRLSVMPSKSSSEPTDAL